jgi:hypothetical protein
MEAALSLRRWRPARADLFSQAILIVVAYPLRLVIGNTQPCLSFPTGLTDWLG